jgi:hypothetical protein
MRRRAGEGYRRGQAVPRAATAGEGCRDLSSEQARYRDTAIAATGERIGTHHCKLE